MTTGVLLAALTLPLTLALMPATVVLLRRLDVRDHPSARSSHVAPTLRGGGIAPALAAVVAAAGVSQLVGRELFVLVLGGGLMGLIGLVEDVKGIPPMRRLTLQIGTAALAAAALHYGMSGLSTPTAGLLFAVGATLWLASYTNAFNFMDGINGISGTQATTIGVGYAAMGLLADAPVLVAGGVIVAGAGLGFLPFNFPRATVFLGDTGSYFFGAWIGILTVIALRSDLPIVAVVAPVALYLCDTGTTLAARVWRREAWHRPHKSHVYQKLTQRGWSHVSVTTAVTVTTAACIALGLLSIGGTSGRRLVAAGAMALTVVAYLLAPHLVDLWRLHRGRQADRTSAGPSAKIGA